MQIYAVADIHARPDRLARIREHVETHAPDAVVIAGDVVSYVNPGSVYRFLGELGVPVLMIRGNTDLAWHERCIQRHVNLLSLHMEKVMVRGNPFVGVSGALAVPFRTRFRLFEKRLLEKAASLVCPKTILVVHSPPYGVLDQVLGKVSAGSKGAAKLVFDRTPRLVLCGHIHEAAGVRIVGKTTIVNCSIGSAGEGVLVHLDRDGDNDLPVVRQL